MMVFVLIEIQQPFEVMTTKPCALGASRSTYRLPIQTNDHAICRKFPSEININKKKHKTITIYEARKSHDNEPFWMVATFHS